MDNFPNGLASYGVPLLGSGSLPRTGFGGAGPQVYPGGKPVGSNIYFVNFAVAAARDAVGMGLIPELPFASVLFAATQTTPNNGDVIFVGPGHIGTHAGALPTWLPAATASGVTIVFLGNGATRAKIRFTTSTAASAGITASNVTIIGARFENAIDGLVAGIPISGSDVRLIDCEWVDTAIANSLIGIITTAAAKRLQILRYRYYEDQTGGGTQKTEHIRLVGGDRHLLEDVDITGDFSTGVLNNVTTDTVALTLRRCALNNLNAGPKPAFATRTTSTGQLLGCALTIASGVHALTAAHIFAADMATGQCVPGATPTVLGHA